MLGSQVADEQIGFVARRVRRFAASIQQGHEFGIPPGDHDDLTSSEFHAAAIEIYTPTMPWVYLVGLGRSFADRARLIEANRPDDPDAMVIARYLRAVSDAVAVSAPKDAVLTPALDDMADTTPPVMPFARLAEIASAAGVAALHDAAERLENNLAGTDECPLTDEELAWLRRLHQGDRIVDIATDHGLAERTLYRALTQVWHKLGVGGRIEGISAVVANGWLDD